MHVRVLFAARLIVLDLTGLFSLLALCIRAIAGYFEAA